MRPLFLSISPHLLINTSDEMAFAQFWAQFMSIFETQYKGSQVAKVTVKAVVNVSSWWRI